MCLQAIKISEEKRASSILQGAISSMNVFAVMVVHPQRPLKRDPQSSAVYHVYLRHQRERKTRGTCLHWSVFTQQCINLTKQFRELASADEFFAQSIRGETKTVPWWALKNFLRGKLDILFFNVDVFLSINGQFLWCLK